MEAYNIYKDIAKRTHGDILIGIVGPVRTGKSTFIKKFMDYFVLPNVSDINEKERVIDEMPQSGAGTMIMTTQPKFVPNEAVNIDVGEDAKMRVRMIDCVGYMVDGARGHMEEEGPRMVRTPWYDYDIPFEDAAEKGTRKVISDHSTIGIVMTTDGTITEIPRSSYVNAEERVVNELKALNKPCMIVLNSANPESNDAQKLRDALSEKYGVTVMLLSVLDIDEQSIKDILRGILFEFPIKQVNINFPGWAQALSDEHWLIKDMISNIKKVFGDLKRVRDYKKVMSAFDNAEYVTDNTMGEVFLGEGRINIDLDFDNALFYKVLGDECGYEIKDDYHLVSMIKGLTAAKKEYDKMEQALSDVRQCGYGIVTPSLDELTLDEPEIIKQGGRYGVRLKASAPAFHFIRVDVKTEISPIIGSEEQSEDMIQYLESEFKDDPDKLWSTNIFGKTLNELFTDGLSSKLNNMPEDAQIKIQDTLQKITNEGSGGLICILL